MRPYRAFEEKLRGAERYRRDEGIAWPVLVDDLAGTVHQAYSTLADPSYLIDADGRVAYVSMWTGVPGLHRAIEALLEQGGRGVVAGGLERSPHLGPPLTSGWRGLRRGLPQSYVDLELSLPTSATAILLGYGLRPLLAPLTQRAEPLPPAARAALTAGAIGLVAIAGWRPARR